jgi:hypothetical protein
VLADNRAPHVTSTLRDDTDVKDAVRVNVVGRFVRVHRTGFTFFTLLAGAELAHLLATDDTWDQLRRWASTNMVNLGSHPVGSLVVSAFLPSSYPFLWLPLVALGVFVIDRVMGWRRSLVLVLFAHVFGTLVSELILDWRVHHGFVEASALRIDDVGPSYVVVCGLTASACYGWLGRDPAVLRLVRSVAAGGALVLLAPSLFEGLTHWEVAAVGHTCALATGVVFGGIMVSLPRRGGGRPSSATPGGTRSAANALD